MLICRKIHYIFMIYLLLLQNLVVTIYALFRTKKLFNSLYNMLIRLYNNTSLTLKKGPTSPIGRGVGLSKTPNLKKLFTVKVDQKCALSKII